jgi:hypothetical protein
MSKAIKTLAVATVVAACTSVAFAQSPPPYWGNYGYPYGYPGEGALPAFPIAPYGDANPSYSSSYGTYPAYTYDPDPWLRAQLRSDFNRGVDTPGR